MSLAVCPKCGYVVNTEQFDSGTCYKCGNSYKLEERQIPEDVKLFFEGEDTWAELVWEDE